MMRRFLKFFYDTWYGACVCWTISAAIVLTTGFVFGHNSQLIQIADWMAWVHVVVSLLAFSAIVFSLVRRRWGRAFAQLGCALGALVVFLPVFFLVSIRAMFTNAMEDFKVEEQPWEGSEISAEIPFSIEFRRSNPFQREFDRRIVFRSGKRVGLCPDTGGAGAFAVYALGTNEFYVVDRLDDVDHFGEYRVNVEKETLECRSGEYVWIRVPDDAVSINGMGSGYLQVSTASGEKSVSESVPVGDVLKYRRFIGRIFPSTKVEIGGNEPQLKGVDVHYTWVSTTISEKVPFACECGECEGFGRSQKRIRFKSGKTVGITPDHENRSMQIYRMKDGCFLAIAREGSFWEDKFRVDVTNEAVCCSYDHRWARIPDDALSVVSMGPDEKENEGSSRIVIEIETKQGNRKAYGDEAFGNLFLGSEYVGRLSPDGAFTCQRDVVFEEALARTKVAGSVWDWKGAHDRFYALFSKIFSENLSALDEYVQNSPKWEIGRTEDHRCAIRILHAGGESCVVRLNLEGKKPGSCLAAKGRCHDPKAGYYAAALEIIEELSKITR